MKTNCLPLLILFLFVLFFSIIGCDDDSDANDPAGNALCYWPLDEIEGTIISDISGNNLTGTDPCCKCSGGGNHPMQFDLSGLNYRTDEITSRGYRSSDNLPDI